MESRLDKSMKRYIHTYKKKKKKEIKLHSIMCWRLAGQRCPVARQGIPPYTGIIAL